MKIRMSEGSPGLTVARTVMLLDGFGQVYRTFANHLLDLTNESYLCGTLKAIRCGVQCCIWIFFVKNDLEVEKL